MNRLWARIIYAGIWTIFCLVLNFNETYEFTRIAQYQIIGYIFIHIITIFHPTGKKIPTKDSHIQTERSSTK